ncbi:MAG: S1 RNA-binding domain-containing protein, partial [Lachnospiraceae bacterium]|nr:S1 RNA-binding domain-containing protein [Lachnospiraceae bacterium]
YMEQFIGEEFEGVISGVTSFGIFVELPDTIEGMVPVRDMKDDYYIFDDKTMELCGEKSKKIYRLGMSLKVRLVNVSEEMRTIDFKII